MSKEKVATKTKVQKMPPMSSKAQIENTSPDIEQIMKGSKGMPNTIAGLVAPLKIGSMMSLCFKPVGGNFAKYWELT